MESGLEGLLGTFNCCVKRETTVDCDYNPGKHIGGLPLLCAQFQKMGGSFAWIREGARPEHRDLRRAEGLRLQKALKNGGYAVDLGGKIHTIRFRRLREMLATTRSISVSEGLPAARSDPYHKTEFSHGGNPIARAQQFTARGFRTVAVNAASAYQRGGGFTTGGRHALEEAFCSQSTLYQSLASLRAGEHSHIPEDGAVVSPGAEIFRRGSNQGYPLYLETVPIAAVVSIAMYNRNSHVHDNPVDAPADGDAYELGVSRKLKAMVHAALLVEADALVIPDVGCGVFHNDPIVVGRLVGEALRQYCGYFLRVHFTGKHAFFQAAASSLMVSPVHRPVGTKIEPCRTCVVCGVVTTTTSDLSLLLSPSGEQVEGLQFLHTACTGRLASTRPGHMAMILPEATEDPSSFLRALDVDDSGVLSKSEVRCAIAALWSGEPKALDEKFDERWTAWKLPSTGLCVEEGAKIPEQVLNWLRRNSARGG